MNHAAAEEGRGCHQGKLGGRRNGLLRQPNPRHNNNRLMQNIPRKDRFRHIGECPARAVGETPAQTERGKDTGPSINWLGLG